MDGGVLIRQRGWRGPYLQGGIALNATDASNLRSSFKDSSSTPNHHVHVDLANDDNVILDSWGRPIVIQNSPSGFRLVSAGPGFGLGIGDADIETPINGNRPSGSDDRILYLNAPTPASDVNPGCD